MPPSASSPVHPDLMGYPRNMSHILRQIASLRASHSRRLTRLQTPLPSLPPSLMSPPFPLALEHQVCTHVLSDIEILRITMWSSQCTHTRSVDLLLVYRCPGPAVCGYSAKQRLHPPRQGSDEPQLCTLSLPVRLTRFQIQLLTNGQSIPSCRLSSRQLVPPAPDRLLPATLSSAAHDASAPTTVPGPARNKPGRLTRPTATLLPPRALTLSWTRRTCLCRARLRWLLTKGSSIWLFQLRATWPASAVLPKTRFTVLPLPHTNSA